MLRSVESGNRQNQQKGGTLPAVSSLPGRHAAQPESRLAHLQAVHGNQGVQRLLRGGVLQRKLTINQPGDAFEQEADRVAESVMGVPTPGSIGRTPITGQGSNFLVQRLCPTCEREMDDSIHRRCSHCEEELHSASQSVHEDEAGAVLENDINHLRGGGQPLPRSEQAFFGARIGFDFRSVRIHTDAHAAGTAQAINALAYTKGTDIVFAPGEYRPDTVAGRKLLAHELTHVVQQGGIAHGAATTMLQRTCGEAAIGSRTECTPAGNEPVGDLILFKVNCDEYLTIAEANRVKDFADSMEDADRVRIHGFASTDGVATFNQNLSCARAQTARDTLVANGIDPLHIDILRHGPTTGPAARRRSVVLERIPGASRPVVPQLSSVITTPLAPGACGGINLVAQWQLNRNSAAAGGFVVQEINESWNVQDCTGVPVANPDPRTSPLRFFEAWRVPTASTSGSPFTSDTWFWPSAAPWAGGCMNGTVTIQGHARYFDNLAALPAHMIVNNPATFSGSLQSSVTDPALTVAASRPVNRSLRLHWTCCPCSSSPTIVDSSNL
jgi:hypothetical protein